MLPGHIASGRPRKRRHLLILQGQIRDQSREPCTLKSLEELPLAILAGESAGEGGWEGGGGGRGEEGVGVGGWELEGGGQRSGVFTAHWSVCCNSLNAIINVAEFAALLILEDYALRISAVKHHKRS